MDPAPEVATPRGTWSLDDLGREAEHLLRSRVEMDRRLVARGLGTLADVVRLADGLRATLGALSSEELAWAQERIARLVERLEVHARELERVRELKLRIGC